MTESHHCLHDDDMLTDEGDEYSEESVCQGYQSRIKSNNPPSPVSYHESVSLQSIDYCDLSTVVSEREERLVTVPGVTFNPFTLRRELAKMFVLHEYPLSMFDHIGFRDFLHNLNPLYGMVSQSSIENDIMSIFKIERCMPLAELSSDDLPCGRVAITTKIWTSSDCSRRFLAITGHFVHHEGKKRPFIMRFVNVPLPCTNQSISKIILDCISYFKVEKKLSTTTVDSYTSDDELIGILMDKLSVNKLLFRGKLFWLPCFAYTMSLMVQEGFEVVRHVIKKVQDSIVFWTSSPEREMAFAKAACELGIKTTTKLVLDDGLSWSSTYLMLQESIVFKDVFSHLGEHDSQNESLPSTEEWNLAGEVCNRLQCLYDYMTILAKEWDEECKQCELDFYLKQSVGRCTRDSDVLSWWELYKPSFPILHTMAKDILAIPIFSVDAFDFGDRILDANRSRLNASMVEALMCTQRWVRGRQQHSDSEVSSTSANNLHTLGTIHDDANVEHGIVIKTKSAESAGDITGEEALESSN